MKRQTQVVYIDNMNVDEQLVEFFSKLDSLKDSIDEIRKEISWIKIRLLEQSKNSVSSSMGHSTKDRTSGVDIIKPMGKNLK